MNELDQVKEYLQSLQSRIVAELEQLDGKASFRRDAWQRPGGEQDRFTDGTPWGRVAGRWLRDGSCFRTWVPTTPVPRPAS